MKHTALFLLLLTLTTTVAAAPSNGKCLLEVNGETYLDGTCAIEISEGGDFTIGVSDTNPSKYFAYVTITGKNQAEASWNGKEAASHAQEPIAGTLSRKGACWQNKNAKICAWK